MWLLATIVANYNHAVAIIIAVMSTMRHTLIHYKNLTCIKLQDEMQAHCKTFSLSQTCDEIFVEFLFIRLSVIRTPDFLLYKEERGLGIRCLLFEVLFLFRMANVCSAQLVDNNITKHVFGCQASQDDLRNRTLT